MPAREKISVKRVYDSALKADGERVLVDRLWPRALTKEKARIDLWLRDLAPSNEIRKWIHSHPLDWPEFREKYFEELRGASAAAAVDQLLKLIASKPSVTLLFASKNAGQNNATVLKEFIDGRLKRRRSGKVAAVDAISN